MGTTRILAVAITSLCLRAEAGAVQGSTTRVSVGSGGVQANGESYYHDISGDARLVVFQSVATNLVPGDTNGGDDIFMHDRATGITRRVSVDSSGNQANDWSSSPLISSDGRFVLFDSSATNLVPGDSNDSSDVFVHELQPGITTRANISSSGAEANGWSAQGQFSADGRYVLFTSAASNLVAGDVNSAEDVFLRDRVSGTTVLVSVSSSGAQALNGGSSSCALSADGRFAVFASFADNLVPGDTTTAEDIFVRDLVAGQTTRVSVSSSGVQANGDSYMSDISADGRYVVFDTYASNLVAGDTNDACDVFVHDRATGQTTRASLSWLGTQSSSSCYSPAISDDGRWVIFTGSGSGLVPDDTNGVIDVFAHDRVTGETTRASVSSTGEQGNAGSPTYERARVSGDGRFVVFGSAADNLVPGDTNAAMDAFVRDRGAVLPVPTTYCTAGLSTHGCAARIAAGVNPSVTFTEPCRLVVSDVEGARPVMIFYGIDNSGFSPVPWGAGSSFMCVRAPRQHTAVLSSNGTDGACNGTTWLDWDAFQQAHPVALGNPWLAGAHVFAQCWYRDPQAPAATNLSDAVKLTYLP